MNDTLNVIKEEVRRLDPKLRSDELGFQAAVILMAAALVKGPNTEPLASFTGYPTGVVADISKRMHEAGLWENGTVKTDHWFDGDKWTVGFWADTLVAEGLVVTHHREDGEREYRVRDKGELQ